jgi:LmbE family N-acetylglucosaminyl deacetylase
MNKALVIAAHPDDEILGCGGTAALLVEKGFEVRCLLMTRGVESRHDQGKGSIITKAQDELNTATLKAHSIIGFKQSRNLDLPDNQMDTLSLLQVVKKIEAELDSFKPQWVFTHHAGDLNIDHRITHQATITATRPLPGQSVKGLFFFEVSSSTDWVPAGSQAPFTPNYFFDISETLDKKIAALGAYKEEMREFPHARSLEAVKNLAHWRGASQGFRAAEAFILGRLIHDF